MTARIHDNILKGLFFLILFIVLLLQTLLANAQSAEIPKSYRGFVASFGAHSGTISSTIAKIDQSRLLQSGGSVGLVFGNAHIRTKIGLLGYYSSSAISAGSTDLYESDAALNIYPLSWITGNSLVLNPYLTGGIAYDRQKFFGYYLNQEPGQTNYSQAEAPYIGKIKQVNATAGIGLEIRLRDRFDFVHLFTEFNAVYNLTTKTNNPAFAGTQIHNQGQLIVGVSFGAIR